MAEVEAMVRVRVAMESFIVVSIRSILVSFKVCVSSATAKIMERLLA
jgi:hypothetical protein